MAQISKTPLRERLQMAGSARPAAFGLFMDDFFCAAAPMTGNETYLLDVYNERIQLYNDSGRDLLLFEMIHLADSLPPDERDELFYRILIEPFALLYEAGKES